MTRARLHVVTGKGGVGKSTVCAAIALASARRGARTLAVEIPDRAGLCRILGVAPAGPGDEAQAAPKLAVSYFDGAAALSEYLGRVVRLGRLLELVLDHPLYRAFVAAAPGVQELMAIGKVRDELRSGRWDCIVVDAGASGHSLQLLRMPAAAAGAFSSGRVHRESDRIDALLRDPAVCAVHVVATPEEMPLREAEHVIATVRDELRMPLGAVFVNQCRPPPPADLDEAVRLLDNPVVAAAARRALGWVRIQEAGIAALEDCARVRVTRLPRLMADGGHADALAAYVAEAVL